MTAKFPRTTFKGLAGTQVAVGILIMLIGITDVILTIKTFQQCEQGRMIDNGGLYSEDDHNEEFNWEDDDNFKPRPGQGPGGHHGRPPMSDDMDFYRGPECDNPMMMYPSFYAGGIWMGMLLIITGSLGIGAARTVLAHRQSGLKTGYLVMNIVLCLFFLPLLTGLGVSEAILSSPWFHPQMSGVMRFRMVLGGILGFVAFVQFIFAIVSASISCCCAPVIDYQVIPVAANYMYVAPPAMISHSEKAGLINNELTEEKVKPSF